MGLDGNDYAGNEQPVQVGQEKNYESIYTREKMQAQMRQLPRSKIESKGPLRFLGLVNMLRTLPQVIQALHKLLEHP